MNIVTDLSVKRISFVKNAATRDPDDPTKPHRALLWKSADGAPERTPPMATATPTFDEQANEIATDLIALESALKKTESPELAHRLEGAITHARRKYGALHHPERADAIRKAETEDATQMVGPAGQFVQKAERLAKSEKIRVSQAMEQLYRERGVAA